jgi:hypothetical protein
MVAASLHGRLGQVVITVVAAPFVYWATERYPELLAAGARGRVLTRRNVVAALRHGGSPQLSGVSRRQSARPRAWTTLCRGDIPDDSGDSGGQVRAAQYGDLVTQDQDLDVFRCVRASEQRQPAQHAGKHQVRESEGHTGRSCCAGCRR